MRPSTKTDGFTLVELMIVVAIIAILAAVATPKLVSARLSANENATIATLRSIAAAQVQLQSSVAIDTDADGGGEYGFFGELAGSAPIRDFNGGAPAVGTIVLDPTYLPIAFGNVVPDGSLQGIVERQGYYYKMWLPNNSATNPIAAVNEAGGGGNDATLPGSSNAEIMWCCYAWPVQATKTGNRAFMVNESGDVVATQNQRTAALQPYNGTAAATVPAFDAAFSAPLDMGSDPALASVGAAAQDGRTWTPVGN